MTKVVANVSGRRTEVDIPVAYRSTVTTNASGVATITFPTAFPVAPIVSLTCVTTSTTQVTVAEITSVTTITLVIKTWATKSTVIAVGGTAQPVAVIAATVHVLAYPA